MGGPSARGPRKGARATDGDATIVEQTARITGLPVAARDMNDAGWPLRRRYRVEPDVPRDGGVDGGSHDIVHGLGEACLHRRGTPRPNDAPVPEQPGVEQHD